MSSNIVRTPPDTTPREMPPAVKPAGVEDLLLKDPVCGMSVTIRSPHMTMQEGAAIYFCSAGCKTKYLANPAKYSVVIGSVQQSSAPAIKDAVLGKIYTCPMHPQIRQGGPGSCPICGMTLEPETAALDSDENPERKDFRRRFFWTLPLTVIVAVLAMAGHRVQWLNGAMESWIELALSLPIVLWAGWPFFVRAVQSLIHRSPNMWTLIGLGTSAAFLYSVIATLAPGVFPHLSDVTRSALGIERPLPNLRCDQIAVGLVAQDRSKNQF
jgi:P-type Cu+ transporter